MYKLLIVLIFSFIFTQEPCEGTCLSEEETQGLYGNIQALEMKREVCESAYLNLESQIKDYDVSILNYKEQMNLCEEQIEIKNDMIKTIKPKWYHNRYIWFFGGVIFTSGSVFLTGQIK